MFAKHINTKLLINTNIKYTDSSVICFIIFDILPRNSCLYFKSHIIQGDFESCGDILTSGRTLQH
jgi:hypothetical protein